MYSISWTGRVVSRVLLSGLTNYYVESNNNRLRESHLVYAVCGFAKDMANAKVRKCQFGDDAWFAAKTKTADVLGKSKVLRLGLGFL